MRIIGLARVWKKNLEEKEVKRSGWWGDCLKSDAESAGGGG